MKFSYMSEIPSSREMISAFGGYNHNIRIGEGEFYDTENLTSSEYPSLSPRKKRGIYKSPKNPLGIIAKDKLCYVDGSDLYIGDEKVEDFELNPNTEKTLVSMGAYLIIMPDKKYINIMAKDYTGKYTEKGDINQKIVLESEKCYFQLCRRDGTFYSQPSALGSYVIKEQPVAPTAEDYGLAALPNETYWMDTSNNKYILKVYSSSSAAWMAISNTYVRLKFSSPLRIFKDKIFVDDGIIIEGIKKTELSSLNGNFVVESMWNHTDIIIKGFINTTEQYAVDLSVEPITISRGMPDMDFVIESNNRLWGCRYGLYDGKMVNEIYASKLGDFKNWECFAGISTDSYVVTVGSDGPFTGAINYLGYPLFFKEDCIHKVYGSYPSNYQVQTTVCRGVQAGSEHSLAILNETLFYKSRNGVCAYEGSLPVEISGALGNERYTEAVGGSVGNKYYISMRDVAEKDPQKQYKLFVYDMARNMWHKEDNTQAVRFCRYQESLYYIDRDNNQIRTVEALLDAKDGEVEDGAVKWSAESGILGTGDPDKKYVSRLDIRLSMTYGSRVTFYVEYDSSGIWEPLYNAVGTTVKTVSVPVRVKRCDHFRIKIEGRGDAQIFSIAKTIGQGSEH